MAYWLSGSLMSGALMNPKGQPLLVGQGRDNVDLISLLQNEDETFWI